MYRWELPVKELLKVIRSLPDQVSSVMVHEGSVDKACFWLRCLLQRFPGSFARLILSHDPLILAPGVEHKNNNQDHRNHNRHPDSNVCRRRRRRCRAWCGAVAASAETARLMLRYRRCPIAAADGLALHIIGERDALDPPLPAIPVAEPRLAAEAHLHEVVSPNAIEL